MNVVFTYEKILENTPISTEVSSVCGVLWLVQIVTA